MGIIIKVFTILFSILLIAGAIGVAMLAFPIFGNQALIVRSGSMEPSIEVGSVVVIREAPGAYKKGDVISFRHDKKTIITHRITEVLNNSNGVSYKTKGDANEEEDNWVVASKDVLGKNYATVPEFGKLLAFARSKYGFPLLIIFPAALVIFIELINIIREIRKSKKKKEIIHPLSFETPHSEKYEGAFTKKNFGLVKIMLPFILFSLFIQSTSAFFSDTETSKGNYFQAASTFGTPTPTPTPSDTACSGSIIISGNGAFSYNKAYLECIKKKVIEQNNTTIVNTQINSEANTGGNSSSGNTGTSSAITTGNATNETTVIIENSQNSSN